MYVRVHVRVHVHTVYTYIYAYTYMYVVKFPFRFAGFFDEILPKRNMALAKRNRKIIFRGNHTHHSPPAVYHFFCQFRRNFLHIRFADRTYRLYVLFFLTRGVCMYVRATCSAARMETLHDRPGWLSDLT